MRDKDREIRKYIDQETEAEMGRRVVGSPLHTKQVRGQSE